MNFTKFAVFSLSAIIALTISAYAATFTDDMTLAQNTAETQYFGLRPYSGLSFGLSDPSLLEFANTSVPLGGAIYRVNGAEMITVGIYTFSGTCVKNDESGLSLGAGTVQSSQAKWSKAENMICCNFGGGSWRIVLDSVTVPIFEPVDALPHDLIGYGLNIYASADGRSFGKPLSASVVKSIPEALCYEEYTALIPASAKYIKVEINDVTSFPLSGGGIVMNPRYTRLARAKISGEALVMGEPAQPVQQSVVITPQADGEDEEEPAEIEDSVESIMPKIEKFEAEEVAPEEKSSSSKFEGTITSSSNSQKKASSKADTQESEVSSKKSESSVSSSSQLEPPREEIYEIRREKSGGLLNSGVTAYIIAAGIALGLLLIFGKGPIIKK